MTTSTSSKLRKLLEQVESSAIICPGIFDCLSATIAAHGGAKVLYVSGAGVCASSLGLPDIGLATMTEMSCTVSRILAANPSIPVVVDADTGYGGALMCARTFGTYARAGAAAIHVEDQVLSKRCGHLLGKEVVTRDEFAARIKAMSDERDAIGSDMLIIARTDAIQSYSVQEAIERMRLAADKGADIAFVEGIRNEKEARKITEELSPLPCLINLVANGDTPPWNVTEACELGFKIALFPCVSAVPATIAMEQAIKELFQKGSDVAPCHGRTPQELFMSLGLKELIRKDLLAGGNNLRGL